MPRKASWTRRCMCGRGLAFLALAVVAGAPSEAAAFRTAASLDEIPDDAFVHWSGPIQLELSAKQPPGIELEDLQAAVKAAQAPWQSLRCANVLFAEIDATNQEAVSGDGLSTIQWIPSGWSARGFDPTALREHHTSQNGSLVNPRS